ncbi:MAG: hypothetical protein HY445_00505 [Candidatus Niyogibacteria bacterium]|nr:hypothetical protein [Candidatus Niyogibacteria bacterium]
MEFNTPPNMPQGASREALKTPMGAGGNREKSSVFLIIVIIVFLALIAVSAWFFFQRSTITPEDGAMTEEGSAGPMVELENDTTGAIEQDIQGTNFGDIDTEFEDIDQELQNL